MKLDAFVDALRELPYASDLSVYSDGGYLYRVVNDRTGDAISPAELGIRLTIEGGDYVKVDGNVYSHTATITPSEVSSADGHVRSVEHLSNFNADLVRGDIP